MAGRGLGDTSFESESSEVGSNLKHENGYYSLNEGSDLCDTSFITASDSSRDATINDNSPVHNPPVPIPMEIPPACNVVNNSSINVHPDSVTQIPELSNLQVDSRINCAPTPEYSVAHLSTTTVIQPSLPEAIRNNHNTIGLDSNHSPELPVTDNTYRPDLPLINEMGDPTTTVPVINDLSSIADWTSGPDAELANTVIQLTDSDRTLNQDLNFRAIRTNNDQASIFTSYSRPLYLDRCSPTQVVASTGGVSPEIILNVDGEDEVDFVNDVTFDETDTKLNTTQIRTVQNDHTLINVTTPTDSEESSGTNFILTPNSDRMDTPDFTDGVRRLNSVSLIKKSSSYTSPGHPSNVLSNSSQLTASSSTSSRLPLLSIDLSVAPQLTPSTPEEVDASSELVFSNFMTERYRMEVMNNTPDESNSCSNVGREFESLPRADVNSVEYIVARNLAKIGDEINMTCGLRLDRMIKLLPVDECPIQIFNNVARVLFARGPTNWGQVISLFYFGYRLVLQRVRHGVANAFYQVCRCLISFCRATNIFFWIAQQGGWKILQFLRLKNADNQRSENDNQTIPGSSSSDNSQTAISETQAPTNLTNDEQPPSDTMEQLIPIIVVSSSTVLVIALALFYCFRSR